MLETNFAVYLGKEKDNSFSGFIAEGALFLALEVPEGLSKEDGMNMLKLIKKEIEVYNIDNLFDFEQFLNDSIKKFNLPSTFSLAAGLLKDKILYLKSTGEGKIFLKRGNEFAKIIEGNNSASGYTAVNDFYIFTTSNFVDLFGGDLELRSIFDSKSPHEVVDALTPQLKSKEDYGAIALFIQTKEKESETQNEESKIITLLKTNMISNLLQKAKIFFALANKYFRKLGRRKTIIFLAVVALAFVLFGSIIFGFIKNTNSEAESKLTNTKQLVDLKLKQANDVAILNLPRALALIGEANDAVNSLKKQLGSTHTKEIADLKNLITTTENKITNKQEKSYEEFYDLTFDNKSAKGDKFYLDGDALDILDKSRGVIYTLSLTKKSLDHKSAPDSKLADFVASSNGNIIFFVGGKGIYQVLTDGNIKKVIDVDKDWGSIMAMSMFNGNIYLLDRGKDQIYKYVSADSGYSDKNLYFRSGSGVSFKDSNSLAIDSSIYIGFPDHILKYTAATPENFNTIFPQDGVKMTEIFTSPDVEKVYVWDRNRKAIYIIAKDGTYEGEISSSILSSISDFAVYQDTAYVLLKEKIYSINLH